MLACHHRIDTNFSKFLLFWVDQTEICCKNMRNRAFTPAKFSANITLTIYGFNITFLMSLPIAQSTSKWDDFWSSLPRITLQLVPSIIRSSSSLMPSNLSSFCKSEYLISLLWVAKLATLRSRSYFVKKLVFTLY